MMMKQKETNMSKRSQAIEVIKSNPALTPDAIVALISDKIGVNLSGAKSYYRYIIKNGLATGNALVRSAKATKSKLAKAPKAKQSVVDRVEKTIASAINSSLVKASNLQKMKEISKRKNYGNRVSQAVEMDDPDFDAQAARDEVERMLEERNDIKSIVPKFLHKEMGLG
jgi:hypothetical protein